MQRKRRTRSRGAVIVEYSFLLIAVGIPAVGGLLLGGKHMYDDYTQAKKVLLGFTP